MTDKKVETKKDKTMWAANWRIEDSKESMNKILDNEISRAERLIDTLKDKKEDLALIDSGDDKLGMNTADVFSWAIGDLHNYMNNIDTQRANDILANYRAAKAVQRVLEGRYIW